MFKLLRFLKPFALLIALVLVLVFLQSLAELYLPTLMSNIVDVGIVNGDTRYILRIGGLMLLVAAGGVVCSILARGGFYADLYNSQFMGVLAENDVAGG